MLKKSVCFVLMDDFILFVSPTRCSLLNGFYTNTAIVATAITNQCTDAKTLVANHFIHMSSPSTVPLDHSYLASQQSAC